ncbi:MAG: aromatic aminobenezylarsenical efflux permease ArsG family transporter [Saprospiraceae bacterium]|nr:aromatic aminobenezylarsenical efflux permease ArsG family transporter [Saprospiraceae bacterium]MCF8250547.1 aromatic aminobenezylarsenical efflux permease ArsG family transporter [Saprospiraceae bacterium]MCF8279687.1 aromatic aminobenezylarsenical efflux permease ArsG family transporter [Bacteroidales bacterium]MCF8312473.1 aromatic aminobenezylarsenical efflux permease ArsG family transporter [Saprospiraceae bacterium]MCF8440710.1 aromatic aminobenezylarsenical efflux permease ArsG famil
MDYLQSILDGYNIPIISAFVLGLMTAISPCPLATNITATAFISKNISSKRKVLLSGVLYSMGRAFSYTVIGLVLYFGASKFHVARLFQQNGEKYLGVLLIIVGLIMLNVIQLNFLGKSNFQEKLSERFNGQGLLGSFLLGVVFALAFCPYSGALYFGMLIPMTISSASGLYLPIVFAIGTGLPVILFTYLLAFAAHRVGAVFNKISKVEKMMRYVAGGVFVLTGIYYVLIFAGVL